MAGLRSIIIMLFVLIFYVNTVSSTGNNTTAFDNFTVEWEDFNLLICAIPTSINISLFTCLPSAEYTEVDDQTCLQEITMNFDSNGVCSSSTTAVMYTSSIAITTQQITTENIHTTQVQGSTNTVTATIQSTTTTPSIQSNASTITGITSTPSTTNTGTTYNSTTAIINTTQASNTSSATTSNTTQTSITGSATTSNTTQTSITGSATTHTSTTAIISYGKNITSTSSHSYNTTITGSTTTTTAANVYSCPNEYYIGTYCNVSSDPCAMSEPCLNGATCFPNSTFPYGYFCQCVIGYSGDNCEYNDGACMANTCWNNGTCIPANSTLAANNGSTFRCECVQGFYGVYCQLKVDLCGNITCENRGVCITVELTWECLCLDPTLYYGLYCQYTTGKLKLQEILSKSFAWIAIAMIIGTCTFIVIMDILRYAFDIDPVEGEREGYRKRLEERRRARRRTRHHGPKIALRFQYLS